MLELFLIQPQFRIVDFIDLLHCVQITQRKRFSERCGCGFGQEGFELSHLLSVGVDENEQSLVITSRRRESLQRCLYVSGVRQRKYELGVQVGCLQLAWGDLRDFVGAALQFKELDY